ncbi:MAG: S8 family serine peptidase [Bryobacteraceae bacterium]
MVAFDTLLGAPDAVLLDYALLQAAADTWSSFLSDALAAFADLISMLQREPGPLVVNNSWGLFDRSTDAPIGSPENYSANPNHPFNQIVGSLVAAGADVLFAAGNCGEDCPDGRCGEGDTGRGASIHGANSHASVLTIAAVTVDKGRLGYSSQGPGGLTDKKPDVAAYSHFAGSGVYKADGGTSAACPVAAGVVAALRQAAPNLSPAELKGIIQKGADLLGLAWDYDTGYGVINAERAWSLLSKERLGARLTSRPAKRKFPSAWMLEPNSAEAVMEYAESLRKRAVPARGSAQTMTGRKRANSAPRSKAQKKNLTAANIGAVRKNKKRT